MKKENSNNHYAMYFTDNNKQVEVLMVSIKAFFAGLTGVSLCMANISGIVTDTGTTPIAGAVIQLEKGGQSATTGADGSFTLIVSNAILPVNGKSLLNGLSARVAGNTMIVRVAERSAIEVATFDLTGKALSTIHKTMDAGSHSLSLPYQGAGIYLYKVKSKNSALVLKGNSCGGISSGSSVTTQRPSSNLMAKQALSSAEINDVITATKDEYLNYRCVQHTYDTTGIQIRMIASAGTLTDADGNVYQTVKIGNQVWMAENLRVTKYNDGITGIPLDTAIATWTNATTPKYCFSNNTANADGIKKYGALYNGYVLSPTNAKQIAPTGWHVPSNGDWDTLQNSLIAKGYNWDRTTTGKKMAKSLAAKTDWDTTSYTGTIGCDLTLNNRSGFSALPGGSRDDVGGFSNQSDFGAFWSATGNGEFRAYFYHLSSGGANLSRDGSSMSCAYSVRLVKD